MESEEDGRSSFRESQLCEEVKPETWTTSDGGTSGSLGLVTSGLLEKSIKEEEIKDEDDLCGGTSSSLEPFTPVEQQNGEILKKPVKEEEPEDENLYCEECRSFFINKCEVHGPALFIPDSPVPMGVTGRARQTLPPGLEIGDSGVSAAALGVFNKGETLPVGAHFGPYQGDLVDKEEAMDSPYSWVIYKSGQGEKYLDAKRETHANWMRYVNCAGNDKEQNLVVFQYRGGIHYRCCRPIQSGQELLLWYKGEHAKDVGITFTHLWNKRSSSNTEVNSQPSQGFSCSLCLVSYTSEMYLHKHIERWHHDEYVRMLRSGEIRYQNLRPTSYTASLNMPGKGEMFHCSRCQRSFIQQKYFKMHRCIRAKPRPYRCSHCGKGFTYMCSLRIHQRIHTGEKPYQCSQCGKRFSQLAHLRSHERIHTGEKAFQCSQCGKGFSQQSNLHAHQRVHTGEKPYYCSQCGKTFTYHVSLQLHRHIHTGEKPYYCSQCGKSFTRPFHLHQHQRIHTGVKTYHCEQCGKNFAHRISLRSHQRIHTGERPYQCPQCGESFAQISTLHHHQRIHTGEKPYQCPQCGKSFRHKGSLTRHLRTHTGERPYQCSHCEKCFSVSGSLARHQRLHQ